MGCVSLASWGWYHNFAVCQKPEIFVGEGYLKQAVLPNCSFLLNTFRPTVWASHRHVQTILGLLRKLSIKATYTRQNILSSDGGTLGLDWWEGSLKFDYAPHDTPILLVLHGINGGSHEGYCKWACATAASKGWRAVVLNYRGCNGVPLTSPRGYAATMTHDVSRAVSAIKGLYPEAPLLAAGYSLGGLVLAKYLGEADMGMHSSYNTHGVLSPHSAYEGSGITAAAVISSPICMDRSSRNLARPFSFSFLYNLAIAYKLREYISEHEEAIRAQAGPMDIDAALNKWTMKEIEDEGLPAQFGYSSRLEYYGHASSLEYIPNIRTPTLFLQSKDDPFLGVLPDMECSDNPYTLLAATARGGHVAFMQGLMPLGRAYMDDAVIQFLDSVLKHYPAQTGTAGRAAESKTLLPSLSEAADTNNVGDPIEVSLFHQHHRSRL
ncbi:hypothetical protein CEUSTIGMA_g2889.t1 [Chlamydomonas eustigma]|uniref:AB hydrolase-1 domain-containing protein n=1 Tax=Chlamydomonas eustigma TaxID=1157962 RepID=A0A250WXD1_9CHLO|nr:hypothetical protein CEUSTIGMA_g2889.t1 [Chlamydomonas eustigma]|eukprot:GAX75445.1 hypothetical protein CEUSTIGMA_g2889.t1 [Chlamydomonas eustigma]